MKKTAHAHYIDRYCENIGIVPRPGARMTKAYRAVREAQMDIRNVVCECPSIVIPVVGEAHFTHCKQDMLLRPGTVAVRWPDEPYDFVKTDDRTLEIFVFYFSADVLPQWMRLFPKACIGLHLCNGAEIIEITKAFFNLVANAPKEQTTDLCDLFATFLLECLVANSRQDPGSLPDPRLLRVVQYMEEQFQGIQDVEEIARHFTISRGTLYNLFKGSAYQSPKKYLTRLRINAATALLMHTSWTLQEIAEELGYENADAFSKAFKNATGVTPRHYKKPG